MSKLEMIIFLADYIEPGRNFPGLEEVRDIAQKDLNHACWMVSRNTIQFLMQKRARIYPDTFHAYNDFTKRLDKNGGKDRKSTRLNSSHVAISYAVFCLKKKTNEKQFRIITALNNT